MPLELKIYLVRIFPKTYHKMHQGYVAIFTHLYELY